jgi:hydroxyethylthiazole kinase-like uncharacterized protein yjeF
MPAQDPLQIAPESHWPDLLRKTPDGHKFRHGHALVVSGGAGRTGAARLAARGALRVGAGLVTLGVPPAAQLEAASQLTAIMLIRLRDARALEANLEDDRLSALCIGPALGLQDREAALVATVLGSHRPTVLDADALTLLAAHPALFSALHGASVLTPHHGEFARLFPDLAREASASLAAKCAATQQAAQRSGCIILFKGAETIVAAPSGQTAIHSATGDHAAPWLATAGSGDVLAGMITGLLARGIMPFEAACIGTWLHAEAARQFGPGLIAEDIPETLPSVFRFLGI